MKIDQVAPNGSFFRLLSFAFALLHHLTGMKPLTASPPRRWCEENAPAPVGTARERSELRGRILEAVDVLEVGDGRTWADLGGPGGWREDGSFAKMIDCQM